MITEGYWPESKTALSRQYSLLSKCTIVLDDLVQGERKEGAGRREKAGTIRKDEGGDESRKLRARREGQGRKRAFF